MHKPALFLLLASFSLNTLAADPLRFATSANNPPFEFYDAQEQLVGFDIDLAKALCQRMNRACVITNNSFEMLLPSLKFRRYDAVISGLDITRERSELVDFTDKYLSNSGVIMAAKGLYNSIDQLQGKRVGVGNDTTHQAWLNAIWPGIVAVTYDNYQNALLDMRNSRLDAIFGDRLVMKELLKTTPLLEEVGQPVKDNHYFGGLAIAIRKGNSELKESVNHELKAMQADGSLAALRKRWFEANDRLVTPESQ